MLHRPQDRVLFVSPHAKMVDVDSIFLKEGQIGIYDTKDTSENGCKAVIDFTVSLVMISVMRSVSVVMNKRLPALYMIRIFPRLCSR